MICPNCKTELVEVNGRYICSDCGREIPENEVMASDWGNGGTVRAGLYGAGTDEPVTDTNPTEEFNTALTESENEIETTKPDDEPTVEEVLQSQQPEEPVATVAEVPPSVPDTGFYTAETPAAEPVSEVKVEESFINIPETPVLDSSLEAQNDTEAVVSEPVIQPEPLIPVTPVQESVMTEVVPTVADEQPEVVAPAAQEIPINTPVLEPTPEVLPEHSEAVKDMFENTAAATAPDPGIYTDPMYDSSVNSEQKPDAVTTTANAPISAEKRMNLIVIIAGSVLTLMLIVGGTWGYLALNSKTDPVVPVVAEETAWQELQSVDGGFKVSFPDQPETIPGTQTINASETDITNFVYRTDDISYSVGFSSLTATNAQAILADAGTTLKKLVTEVATSKKLTVSKTKVGSFYNASAVDFTLSSDTALYQGKLMISGQKYILVMAGSDSGQTTEYDKFIKSFSFVAESTE